MKAFLVILNLLLAAGIGHGIYTLVSASKEKEDPYFFNREKDGKKVQTPLHKTSSATGSAANNTPKHVSPEQKHESIVKQNIFHTDRCSSAHVFGRNRNNARVSMTLVGTFQIGTLQGAIILQKKQNTAQNFGPGMMGPPPGMMGPPGRGNQVQRFGPMGPPGMNRNTANTNGLNAENSEENLVYQQYVRVGETLANGYTLVEITRTGAVLKKGSDRQELTIVEASKNAGSTKGTGSANNNKTQENLSPDQMRQWMDQMRNMRMRGMGGPGGMGGPPGMMGNPGMNGGEGNSGGRNRR